MKKGFRDVVYTMQKLFLDVECEVCCSESVCKYAQKAQKETLYRRVRKPYVNIKRFYDADVQQYKSDLVRTRIGSHYPDKLDKFIQAKEERQGEISRLKRQLIDYGLPSEILSVMEAV